jgi:hypothetical protein
MMFMVFDIDDPSRVLNENGDKARCRWVPLGEFAVLAKKGIEGSARK